MLFIDADNAMGSPRGDVDDAFAITALIRGGAELAGIGSVAGNTSEARAFENNRTLCELLGWRGPLLRSVDVPAFLRAREPMRIAALGPLTNVANVDAKEVIVVGANTSTNGRWPPLWPHEFNLTHDRPAAGAVFASSVPLTIFPLDVARHFWVTKRDLEAIRGPLGDYLRRGSARWFRRLLLVKATRRFSIWDLTAALYALDADGFTMERTTAAMRSNTFIEFGKGSRQVTVCRALRRERLWERFLSLVNG